ncbi:MAG: ribonuclease J [Metamycoplasmataceae bacterium]
MGITKFYGLGGMQEIGKSTAIIEHDDQIFILDAGIKFGNISISGIKGIIPNYGYLKENQNKIAGIFLTHGHEDHMGGIPFLVKDANIKKIFAPRIGIEFLKSKFEEAKIDFKPEFIEIKEEDTYEFGTMKVDFWTAQHSIPDAFGIRFTCPNGSIMFTGDFRFDYSPIGNYTNFDKLKLIGDQGLTALFSDSTNAMRPNHSPSEKDILQDIKKYIKEAEGKVILTSFASNVTRILKIIELAEELDKKVVCFGRAMVKGIKIGRKIGHINIKDSVFIDRKKIDSIEENKLLILTTGSQGEEMAALAKMGENKHPQVKIKNKDIVIFSSSPIPGNRLKIELLINKLFKLGADIKENGVDGYLHTSGHAYQDEHRKIFALTKPKYFFPYHGEYRMSVVHGKTAIECGVDPKNVFNSKIGEVFYMENNKIWLSEEKRESSPVYIDGDIASTLTTKLLNERTVLGENGFVHVIVFINKQEKKIVQRPKIITRGTLYIKNSMDIIIETRKLVYGSILNKIKNDETYTTNQLKKIIKERLVPFFYRTKRRRPLITTSIIFVDDIKELQPPLQKEITKS